MNAKLIGALVAVLVTAAYAPRTFSGTADLAVTERILESKRRVGRAAFEYTYRIRVTNSAGPLTSVVATVTSSSPDTLIVDNTVNLGTLPGGATDSSETFTLRQNRRVRFDPAALSWSFQADDPAPTNRRPVASAGSDVSVPLGNTINLDGSASSDPDNDPLNFSWSLQGPAGSTATLAAAGSAMPQFSPDVAGSYQATLIVDDGALSSAPDSVTLTAVVAGANAPQIVSAPVLAARVGSAYRYAVKATDPDAGDTLTYSLALAPSGMAIDPQSGLITWLPTATGPADVDVRVTDSTGRTARQLYLAQVALADADLPPVINPVAAQTVVVGSTLAVQLTGADPEGEAVRFRVLEGPDGIAVNSTTGVLRWTAPLRTASSTSATVAVFDPAGQQGSTSFPISVLPEAINHAPQLASLAAQTIEAGSALQAQAMATDSDAGDRLTFSLEDAPAGFAVDPVTGFISWAPGLENLGTRTVLVVVTDSAGDRATTPLRITVIAPAAAPVANDDAYTVGLREALLVAAPGVLGNDTDANDDVLSAEPTRQPRLGTLGAFAGDGSFSYQPPAIPPLEIGLAQQCATENLGAQFAKGYSVADVDADGALEIVMLATQGTFSSALRIYDGATCALKADVPLAPELGEASNESPVTLVNLDGDPELEIVVPYLRGSTLITGAPSATQYRFFGLNIDGTPLWNATGLTELPIAGPATNGIRRYISPSAVDLNGDGVVELLVATAGQTVGGAASRTVVVAYNGQDGSVLWEYEGELQLRPPQGAAWTIADLDLDGTVEIIFGGNVLDHEGSLEFLLPVAVSGGVKLHLQVAVANFDNDPYAEIITYDRQTHTMLEHTGAIKWQITRPNFSSTDITVAELDGDPLPEYVILENLNGNATASLNAYDSDGTLLWSHDGTPYAVTTQLVGATTTPVAFDFDRDGIDELVVHLSVDNSPAPSTPRGLYVFAGTDGAELARYTYTGRSTTSQNQGVSIADVDGDGAAELLFKNVDSDFDRSLHVLEGLPGNPFPPARPIHNQHLYQPLAVNDDASIPAYQRPHWLVPGLNKVRAAPVVPGESPTSQDAFGYVADDGSAVSNEATVALTLATVNAPTIVSTPPLGASPDFAYVYPALATDADFGSVLTWSLVDAPAAMTVDTFGIVRWVPPNGALGPERIALVVTDSDGHTASQVFELNVQPPVTVPDLLGVDVADATAALLSAGLATGSVTSAFSLSVPAGAVISQSLNSGSLSGAGALLDVVVSLGPPPVFAPTLMGLDLVAAEALLEASGLALGTVRRENSADMLPGTVLAQSEDPQTELVPGAAVDLTLSSGPALRVALAEPIAVAGTTVALSVATFDADGNPLPTSAVEVAVTASPAASGALPTATSSTLTIPASSRGAFLITVEAGPFGSAEVPVIVRTALDPDDDFAPMATFAGVLDELPGVYESLGSALRRGDLLQAAALASELRTLRDALDLPALADVNPMAPELGFLPDRAAAEAVGFPAGFSILNSGAQAFQQVENALAAVAGYLEQLDPNRTRNDDERARYVNAPLRTAIEDLLALELPVGTQLALNDRSYGLLSLSIPQQVQRDLDFILELLATNGLARAGERGSSALPETRIAGAPGDFYGAARPTFFTLGGMMTATAIRADLIKSLYVPYLTRVVSSSLTLATADALREFMTPQELTAIITGASQSFHRFKLLGSIIEAREATTSGRAFSVQVIGPDTFQKVLDTAAGASRPKSTKEARTLIKSLIEAGKDGAADGVKAAIVHAAERGCFFDQTADCAQIILGGGFPVVHSSGTFPAPVVVLVRDRVTSQLYLGTYPFFPEAAD